jgi:hypothetical protein
MKRRAILWVTLAAVTLGLSASATTSIGIAFGLDPTGLLIISALTETSISESLDIRAEAGLSTDEIAGLMLATGTILYHYPVLPIDPYVGIGAGLALTPPPFSTGVVAEGVAGVRVLPAESLALFGQVRFLVRWSGGGVSTGPIYEAGVEFRF